MARDLTIVLNNGSLNSAIVTALAAQKHRLVMLHAETLQLPGSRAKAAYDQQVQHFKPFREHTLPMPYLSVVDGGSSGANATVADPRAVVPVQPTLIALLPILAAAARFAVHYQAVGIFLGLRVGGQPDELAKASEYVQIWNELLQVPCGQHDVEFVTPLLELEPWQVVDLGFQVNAPMERTWSCAEDSGEPCWACRGCRVREAAFLQAAKPDPLRPVRKV